MAYKVRKIHEEFQQVDLVQILEICQQRGAGVMEVAQRGVYQIDYRGLARHIVFWLTLERHGINVKEKAN